MGLEAYDYKLLDSLLRQETQVLKVLPILCGQSPSFIPRVVSHGWVLLGVDFSSEELK